MPHSNVSTSVLGWSETEPDHPALVMAGQRITYRQLAQAAGRFASLGDSYGLTSGDMVGLYMDSSPAWMAAYFGLQDAGYVPVSLNAMLTAHEVLAICRRIPIRLILADDGRQSRVTEVLDALGTDAPAAHRLDSAQPLTALLPDLRAAGPRGVEGPVAAVMMTSGTSGQPKAAMIGHAALAFGQGLTSWSFGIEPGTRVISPAPLFYDMGIHTLSMTTLGMGGTMVMQSRFDAPGFVDLMVEHEPQLLAAVPTVFGRVAAEAAARGLRMPHVHSCIGGGANLTASAAAQLADVFPNASVRQTYGLTELRVVTGSTRSDPAPLHAMGRACPGVTVRLVSDDGSLVTTPGVVGEALVKTPGTMVGYHDLPPETDVAPGGWFRTGDLVSREEDGTLVFRGRKKEMIVRGGANIYPREIELALDLHPEIAEVAVVAAPHPELGEVPVAFYAATTGADVDGLDSYCRERLAAYKVPVRYERLDSLPKNAHGKIVKRVLVQELGGAAAGAGQGS